MEKTTLNIAPYTVKLNKDVRTTGVKIINEFGKLVMIGSYNHGWGRWSGIKIEVETPAHLSEVMTCMQVIETEGFGR